MFVDIRFWNLLIESVLCNLDETKFSKCAYCSSKLYHCLLLLQDFQKNLKSNSILYIDNTEVQFYSL